MFDIKSVIATTLEIKREIRFLIATELPSMSFATHLLGLGNERFAAKQLRDDFNTKSGSKQSKLKENPKLYRSYYYSLYVEELFLLHSIELRRNSEHYLRFFAGRKEVYSEGSKLDHELAEYRYRWIENGNHHNKLNWKKINELCNNLMRQIITEDKAYKLMQKKYKDSQELKNKVKKYIETEKVKIQPYDVPPSDFLITLIQNICSTIAINTTMEYDEFVKYVLALALLRYYKVLKNSQWDNDISYIIACKIIGYLKNSKKHYFTNDDIELYIEYREDLMRRADSKKVKSLINLIDFTLSLRTFLCENRSIFSLNLNKWNILSDYNKTKNAEDDRRATELLESLTLLFKNMKNIDFSHIDMCLGKKDTEMNHDNENPLLNSFLVGMYSLRFDDFEFFSKTHTSIIGNEFLDKTELSCSELSHQRYLQNKRVLANYKDNLNDYSYLSRFGKKFSSALNSQGYSLSFDKPILYSEIKNEKDFCKRNILVIKNFLYRCFELTGDSMLIIHNYNIEEKLFKSFIITTVFNNKSLLDFYIYYPNDNTFSKKTLSFNKILKFLSINENNYLENPKLIKIISDIFDISLADTNNKYRSYRESFDNKLQIRMKQIQQNIKFYSDQALESHMNGVRDKFCEEIEFYDAASKFKEQKNVSVYCELAKVQSLSK